MSSEKVPPTSETTDPGSSAPARRRSPRTPALALLLTLAALVLLIANERSAVNRWATIHAGEEAMIEADPLRPLPENDGRLILLRGPTSSPTVIRDRRLGVEVSAIRLRRTIEMYQWREVEEGAAAGSEGAATPSYRYERVWSSEAIDSSEFHDPNRQNPPLELEPEVFDAERVKIGAYRLTPELVAQVGGYVALAGDSAAAARMRVGDRPAHAVETGYFLGMHPENPVVGDIRLNYEIAPTLAEVTVLAAQDSDTFAAWTAPSGQVLEPTLWMGQPEARELFAQLASDEQPWNWPLRLLGLLLLFGGLWLGLRIGRERIAGVKTLAPLIERGPLRLALALGPPLTLITMSAVWISRRPWMGIPLVLVGALALGGGLLALARKKRPSVPPSTPM